MNQFPQKIAIIGVGLIGGSIALGLKNHFGPKITILGVFRDGEKAKLAKEAGIIDTAIYENGPLPKDLKLVIIATPVETILKILKSLGKKLSQDSLIIDVGSTKKTICDAARKLLSSKIAFIGTHPMAGNEMSGFENASVNLFRNKPWIVCDTQSPIDKHKLSIVKQLISLLGAKIVPLSAETHDQLTVWASHIFLIISSVLVKDISRQENWKEVAKVASTGFRDTTRLASDNPLMKKDIVFTNKTNIVSTLQSLKNEINIFLGLVENNDEKGVLKYFESAKNIRDGWIANYFS